MERNQEEIKQAVLERYSSRAKEQLRDLPAEQAGLTVLPVLDSSSCCGPGASRKAERHYSVDELVGLPESVTDISLGCGNPTALAELEPGEVVLDLGSGGGIDCFLAARRVGPTGRVIGLDMSPDMIELAQKNAQRLGTHNVEFRLGEMERMPVENDSIDLIISNCVINLSPDKDAVFRETYRVLRPGGRLCVSDLVAEGELPPELRASLEQWAGCVAGTLKREVYLSKLRDAGFGAIDILESHPYRPGEGAPGASGHLLSVALRAVKPR